MEKMPLSCLSNDEIPSRAIYGEYEQRVNVCEQKLFQHKKEAAS